jgi:hypothetical protein
MNPTYTFWFYIFNTHINIILPSMRMHSKQPLSFRISYQFYKRFFCSTSTSVQLFPYHEPSRDNGDLNQKMKDKYGLHNYFPNSLRVLNGGKLCEGGPVKILGNESNQSNSIQEEIKRRLTSGIACYHSVQNLLSSRLLSKNSNN